MRATEDGLSRGRVELPAGPIRYREGGAGRPIVFVHGFGVDGRLWDGTEGAPRVGALVLTNTDCFENFPPGHFKLMSRAMRLPAVPTLFAHSMRLRANRQSPLAYGALTEAPIDDSLLRDWTEPQVRDKG